MAGQLATVVGVAAVLLTADLVTGSMDVHMDSGTIWLGETIELVCDWDFEYDYPAANEEVHWKFNEQPIVTDIPKYKIVTYAQSSHLRISSIERLDQGNYTCVVTQEYPHWATFVLDLHLPPEISVTPNNNPFIDKETNITCSMIGKPRADITWWFGSMDRPRFYPDVYTNRFPRTKVEKIHNKTGSYLVLTVFPTHEQTGYFKCHAEEKTVYARLYVKGISIQCDPDAATVSLGDDVTYLCEIQNWPVTGFNMKNFDWKLKPPQGEEIHIKDGDHKYKFHNSYMGLMPKVGLLVRNVNIRDIGLAFTLTVTVNVKSGETWEATSTISLKRAPKCTSCQASELHCDTSSNQCVCRRMGFVRNQDMTSDTTCIAGNPGGKGPGRDGENPNEWQGASSEDDSMEKDGQQRGKDDKIVVVNHTSVATIVGVTMGALAMILAVIIGYICWRKRRKSKKNESRFDPNYIYQYEYHGEANTHTFNPTFINHGYQLPPPKLPVRKENTYVSTIEKERIEFPREKLQLGVDLGEGRFGKVIQARAMNITGTGNWVQVAVKTCRATATDSEKQDLYQELEIMRKIPPHPNIVALYGCCSKTDPLYIIIEYVQRGNMLEYLRKCRPMSRMSRDSVMSYSTIMSGSTMMSDMSGSSFMSNGRTMTSSFMQPRAKDLTIFALQIARGMAHVANCGIIHRDLAVRNILLATDFTCKICDFGLARDVEGVDVYERTSKGPLPIRWMAPESMHENLYTKKSDVWSYGILLWEIVTLGATPYQGKSANEVMRQVLQGSYLPQPLHCREEMYDLMVKCWEKPDLRPTFAEIANHFEALMDDDYIILSEYDESDYQWLDSYTMEERV